MNKLNQHPSLNVPEALANICKPLGKLNITYFSHGHVDPNNRFSALASSPRFLEHYLKNKYYNADIHMTELQQFGNYIIWDSLELTGKSKKMDSFASACGIKHVFSIIDNDKLGNKNFYHFGTHLDTQSINQVYLNNLDLLNLFIMHFKDQVNQAKELSEGYDFKYELDHDSRFEFKENPILDYSTMRNEFLSEINFDKNHRTEYVKSALIRLNQSLNHDQLTLSGFEKLSMREIECLHLTILGQTAKQIAKVLKISFRTVEEHLTKIRMKIGANNKAELIEKIIMLLICTKK